MPFDPLVRLLEPYLGTGTAATAVAAIALLVGLGRVALKYRRTGEVGFSDLPFRAKVRLIRAIRVEYFTKGTPSTRSPVGEDNDAVTDLLAEHGYIPRWPLSYHYHGEVSNLVRYYYDPDRDLPHRQVHVRLFDREDGEDGVDVYAHEEPFAVLHPVAHVESEDMTDVTAQVVDAYRVARDAGDESILDPRLWVPPAE
ncbi:hypothetical protein HrrHc1_165 [Halorubrum phage Hardycor1]|nr:hypothetical protein HrrHc1_165 [Halorubrum phage Hardycor1]